MGIFRINGRLAAWNGSLVRGEGTVPPEPGSLPADMDFVYLADSFNGDYIPNAITGSAWGPYTRLGNVWKVGSGANAYLEAEQNDNNYLYYDMTSEQNTDIKAENSTYTWFCRVYSGPYSSVGGIMSTRENGGYNYMIRNEDDRLQFHDSSGHTLDNNFVLDGITVYKVQVSGQYWYAKNLSTGVTTNGDMGVGRSMGTRMTSFSAGYSGENGLDRFYGLAGIARATTEEEDTSIKNYLMSQGL